MARSMWMTVVVGCVMACDPGGKSVTATAEDDGGDTGGSSDDGGSMSSTSAGEGSSSATTSSGTSGMTTGADPSAEGGSMEDTGSPDIPPCLDTIDVLDSSAAKTGLGFTADEVLVFAAGQHASSFAFSTDTGSIVIAGAGQPSALTIDITFDAGEIRYVDSQENPEYVDFNPEGCQSRVEIDVELGFVTADGRFLEVFEPAVLTAIDTASVTFSQRVDPDGFAGSFSEADISYEDGTGDVELFDITGTIDSAGTTTGTLWGQGSLNPEALDEDIGYYGTFGSWPVP